MSDDEDPCWRWGGHNRSSDGRPVIDNRYVYKIIYEAVSGQTIPDDYVLHHKCGNPWCVNPRHLESLTRGQHLNEHRPVMKIKCRNGHVLGGDNLYEWHGKRYCKACHRENQRKQRAAKKGQDNPCRDGKHSSCVGGPCECPCHELAAP